MKKWFSKNILYIIGAVVGAIGGLVYWKFVGCSSGACAITSRPLNSAIYGAVMGGLLLSLLQSGKKDSTDITTKDK